ncbi:tyrosine-type recombinase/integrase [Bacillus halotolerans]|uniref:tyrosine-type recombinase/integrase n=1 Tax=Bacillus halotolerans TaxID=260554 RepID=UPI0027BA9623|nr:tyrosine-type recombinase/integrase [Bacillus halotolerans]
MLPHMLRHTLATELAKRGWDLSTIARFLGNTVAVVQRYTIPTEKQMADAAADIYIYIYIRLIDHRKTPVVYFEIKHTQLLD